MTVAAKGSTESFPIRVHATPTAGAEGDAAAGHRRWPSRCRRSSSQPITVAALNAGSSETVNVAPYLQSPLTTPGVQRQPDRHAPQRRRGDRQRVGVLGHRDRRQGRPGHGHPRVRGLRRSGPAGQRRGPRDDPRGARTRRAGSARPPTGSPAASRGSAGVPAGQRRRPAGPPVRGAVEHRPDAELPGLAVHGERSEERRARCRSRSGPATPSTGRAPSAASQEVTPDTAPRAVSVGAVTPGDRTLAVTWAAPANEGSAVDQYQVQWVNTAGGAGGGTRIVAGRHAVDDADRPGQRQRVLDPRPGPQRRRLGALRTGGRPSSRSAPHPRWPPPG